MKNVLIVMSMVILTFADACAQKVSADKIPAAVMNAFNTKFLGATKVEWSMENANEYEAEFRMNKAEQSANFLEDGTWMESEVVIEKSQLPLIVVEAINKLYPSAKIDEVEQASNPKIDLFYGVTVKYKGKKYDIDLKANGEIIKNVEVKENESN